MQPSWSDYGPRLTGDARDQILYERPPNARALLIQDAKEAARKQTWARTRKDIALEQGEESAARHYEAREDSASDTVVINNSYAQRVSASAKRVKGSETRDSFIKEAIEQNPDISSKEILRRWVEKYPAAQYPDEAALTLGFAHRVSHIRKEMGIPKVKRRSAFDL